MAVWTSSSLICPLVWLITDMIISCILLFAVFAFALWPLPAGAATHQPTEARLAWQLESEWSRRGCLSVQDRTHTNAELARNLARRRSDRSTTAPGGDQRFAASAGVC